MKNERKMAMDVFDANTPENTWARGLNATEISVIMAIGEMFLEIASKKNSRNPRHINLIPARDRHVSRIHAPDVD